MRSLIIAVLLSTTVSAQSLVLDQAADSERGQSFARGMSWVSLGAGAGLKTWEAFHSDDKKKALIAEGVGFTAVGLSALGLKYLVGEDRPCAKTMNCGSDDPHKSFPSGHAANACFAIPTQSGKTLLITGILLAAITAEGRIAGNRHYWWDTATGCGDGLLMNALMKKAFKQ